MINELDILGIKPYYQNETNSIKLLHGDCLQIIPSIKPGSIDMIFADPPYFLSNGGITCHAGKMVSVNKGNWDKSNGSKEDHEFTLNWLRACKNVLTEDGTIWVSGTMHNIYSTGFALQKLGYKLLNDISWFKPNAAPNLSCRYFTHSHETLIWAAKSEKSKHKFNYQLMKQTAGGKQMRSLWNDVSNDNPEDIWTISTPAKEEKKQGKHPTQKPFNLLKRVILASSNPGDLILDPFTGASTTGVVALRLGRKFIGIDSNLDYLELSIRRIKQEGQKAEFKPLSHNPEILNKAAQLI